MADLRVELLAIEDCPHLEQARRDLEGVLRQGIIEVPIQLIFVTGPDERDVALTVSQINTHKIRGASTVVIAEDHPSLRGAAEKAPSMIW